MPALPVQRSGQNFAAAADTRDELDHDLPHFNRQARAIPDLTPGTAHNARATRTRCARAASIDIKSDRYRY